MTNEQREELMDLIIQFGIISEVFGRNMTLEYANKEQDYLKQIEEFLDTIQ